MLVGHYTIFPNMKVSRTAVICTLTIPSTCSVVRIDAAAHNSIEARATWTSLGCYTDNVSGRAMPYGATTPGGDAAMTNEVCQNACQSAGYSMAGTEYAGECCTSSIP